MVLRGCRAVAALAQEARGKGHRVALPRAAVGLLRGLLPLRSAEGGGDWVFPGGREGRPLNNMSVNMLLGRMERGDLTVHGLRSCFRNWCAEATAYPCEVAKQALAHALPDKVEAAYRRGDMLEKCVTREL